jgi:thiamine-phosphate pyrophosphorylase
VPIRAFYHGKVLLYAITDRHLQPGDENQRRASLIALARGWAAERVDYIQIREKDLAPKPLLSLTRDLVAAVREEQEKTRSTEPGTRILVNGSGALALEGGADGVHLPENAPADAAFVAHEIYARAGRPLVISRACHSAAEAGEGNADLLLYAPVFEKSIAGKSIPGQGLAALAETCRVAGSVPVLALGGVTAQNARACMEAGARGVAAIRLFLGPEWLNLRDGSL